MALPELVCSPLAVGGVPDILPPGGHVATMEEIRERFVTHPSVPFAAERQVLFGILEIYVEKVWAIWDRAELWIDGGFVTHKTWNAPNDVDVAVVDTYGRIQARIGQAVSLLTLEEAVVNNHHATRVQPFGGMIDGFAVARLPHNLAYWENAWGRLNDANKDQVPNVSKGFVRVVQP